MMNNIYLKAVLICILYFACVDHQAKAQVAYYVTSNGAATMEADSAEFKRVIYERDSAQEAFPVIDFYKSGNVKSRGFIRNAEPLKYHGQKIDYYENGRKKLVSYYENGNIKGEMYSFFPNGKPHQTFVNDTVSFYDPIVGNTKPRILVRSAKDSLGKDMVVNGSGHLIVYDDELSRVTAEGDLLNSFWNGQVKGFLPKEKISFEEIYQGGKLLSGVSRDSLGASFTYVEDVVPPEYIGGMNKFYNLIARNLRYPEKMQRHNIQGKTFLKFTIDVNGKLLEPKIIVSLCLEADEETLRVLKLSKNWSPGLRKGIPIRSIFAMPFSFTLSNTTVTSSPSYNSISPRH